VAIAETECSRRAAAASSTAANIEAANSIAQGKSGALILPHNFLDQS
jgi:hypothetical protein